MVVVNDFSVILHLLYFLINDNQNKITVLLNDENHL